MVDLFLEDHPEVELLVTYVPPEDLRSRVEGAAGTAQRPSLVFAPSLWGRSWLEQGLTEDLAGRFTLDLQGTLRTLAWQSVVDQNSVTGLPLEMHGVVLYRNRDLVPEPAMTLDELVDHARALRGPGVKGAVLDFAFLNSSSHLATCEGTLFDPSGRVAFTGPEGLCWLNLMARWGSAGDVVFGTDEDRQAFASGQTGWILETTHAAEALAASLGSEALSIDPWPVYPETGTRLTGYTWTEAVHLIAGLPEEESEAAWMFALHMLTPRAQLLLSQPQGARHLPSLRALTPEDPGLAQTLTTLEAGIPYPPRPDLEVYIEPLERAVRAVTVLGTPPDLAMQRLIEQLRTVAPESLPEPP